MTIRELIEKLQQLDPDLHVFVHGYEGGYNDADISPVKEIMLNYNTEWYYGKHEEADYSLLGPNHSFKIVKGIIL